MRCLLRRGINRSLETSLPGALTKSLRHLVRSYLGSCQGGKSFEVLTDTRCTGYHPWWAHQIALTKPESKRKHYESLLLPSSPSEEDLVAFEKVLKNQPEPRLLDDILSEVRKNLLDFPNALVGEIGLDRSVRIPYDYDATPRVLSSFTIPFEHQLRICEVQLEQAVELKRNVSMHSVKTHDATLQLWERMASKFGDKFWDVSVDVHSWGVNAQVWKDIEVRSQVDLSVLPTDEPSYHHTDRENTATFSSHSQPFTTAVQRITRDSSQPSPLNDFSSNLTSTPCPNSCPRQCKCSTWSPRSKAGRLSKCGLMTRMRTVSILDPRYQRKNGAP